ncbi:MAG: hypothetical protein WCD35_01505 [Mycobacteriales bacterium]
MDLLPHAAPPAALPHRRNARDRLVNKVSVMGQLTALLAMTSTGITAGVLAHDAQVKDLQAAQARERAAKPAPAPAPRLVHKPIRTVVVKVPAPTVRRSASSRTSTRSTTSVRRTTTYSAPAPVVRKAPARVSQPAPQPAQQPPATTTSGS